MRIASSIGDLVAGLLHSPAVGTLLMTGGDTLLQVMRCAGVRELEPLCELEKGVVLARCTYRGCTRHVITKSGGFGQAALLTDSRRPPGGPGGGKQEPQRTLTPY